MYILVACCLGLVSWTITQYGDQEIGGEMSSVTCHLHVISILKTVSFSVKKTISYWILEFSKQTLDVNLYTFVIAAANFPAVL